MLSVQNCTATLQHLVAATLAPGRGVSVNELLRDLSGCGDLKDGAATLDSLDQLTAAGRVAEFFELERAGTEEFLLRRKQLDQWSEVIVDSLNDGTLIQLWFRSGGTTGEPRLSPQPFKKLLSEVVEISGLVKNTTRIVSLVPLHHIYGFIWGPLLSDQLHVPLVHGPDAVQTVHKDLRSGDLVLGVPEWWQYLGALHNRLPDGVKAVTSTAPCPSHVIQSALKKGFTSMIEVYGSSETAGIGWRSNPERGFELFRHWQRHDDNNLASEAGHVYALPDVVDWQTDRSLIPCKRRDNAVQIGGINVWPDRVKTFIEGHPQVRACAVRALDTGNGTRLKAFIVPADEAGGGVRAELGDWLKDNLPAAECPVQITLGDKLPRNSMGKLCDWS